jgi:hypothetical protein
VFPCAQHTVFLILTLRPTSQDARLAAKGLEATHCRVCGDYVEKVLGSDDDICGACEVVCLECATTDVLEYPRENGNRYCRPCAYKLCRSGEIDWDFTPEGDEGDLDALACNEMCACGFRLSYDDMAFWLAPENVGKPAQCEGCIDSAQKA